jgi:hypothetical protein
MTRRVYCRSYARDARTDPEDPREVPLLPIDPRQDPDVDVFLKDMPEGNRRIFRQLITGEDEGPGEGEGRK